MKTRFIITLFFCAFSPSLFAQPAAFINTVKAGLDSFTNKFPQEKIYVHTDRYAYKPTETIWFKLYAMTDGLPTYVSKVAYVDLINSAGVVIDKKTVQLIIISTCLQILATANMFYVDIHFGC